MINENFATCTVSVTGLREQQKLLLLFLFRNRNPMEAI